MNLTSNEVYRIIFSTLSHCILLLHVSFINFVSLCKIQQRYNLHTEHIALQLHIVRLRISGQNQIEVAAIPVSLEAFRINSIGPSQLVKYESS